MCPVAPMTMILLTKPSSHDGPVHTPSGACIEITAGQASCCYAQSPIVYEGMGMGRYSRVVPAVAIALIGVALYPVAHAAIVGEYGQWTVSGKTGTVFAPDAHFPTGSVSS